MKKEDHQPKVIKTPWPTKAAMVQIYEKNLWGGNASEFYSGEGSHLPELVNPYIEAVSSFLTSFESKLIVCDLGCGDFNVGKELVKHAKKYVAIDIVPELIEKHKERFKAQGLEFNCLDLAEDPLPSGDCALIRQVFQHLSNAEIQSILQKLSDFKYLILTEHIPQGAFEPNKDIISGQGIRLKKQSGVNILAAPFNFEVKEEKQLVSVLLKDGQGIVVTTLYKI